MVPFLSKHKRAFLLTGMAVCLAGIILSASGMPGPAFISATLGYAVTPIQRGFASAWGWIGGKMNVLIELDGLREENELLRARIRELEIDNIWLQNAEDENKRLTALFEMDQQYAELPKLGARVIGTDPDDWYDGYNIDKGADDGLEPGMAILGEGGLIGVVREVFPTYSKAVSLLDNRCQVAVMCRRTEDTGMLHGDLNLMPQGLCRMNYIEEDAEIIPGDEIVTSALGSQYPSGITVGTVMSVEADGNGLTKHAVVEPVSQTGNLELVLILNELYN